MSQKVIILKPRLDVPFKYFGTVSETRGPIIPLRQWFTKFVDYTHAKLESQGYKVFIMEKPLWEFTPEMVGHLEEVYDIIYVPHHCRKTFDPNHESLKIVYYMQMVFPWLFQVDSEGWCADASVWPIKPLENYNPAIFGGYRELALSGKSKMDQPKPEPIPFENYILFPCQLPHDQTISLHSNVSVADALRMTLEFARSKNLTVLVKPHPANPGSMAPLYQLFNDFKYGAKFWVNFNIHSLIQKSIAVFSVNSGVGMEALLHDKPVFCYGRADYASVTHFIDDDIDRTERAWRSKNKYISEYPAFIHAYVKSMTDLNPTLEEVKL